MKLVSYTALFTLLAIGAMAAEQVKEADKGKNDQLVEPSPRADQSEEEDLSEEQHEIIVRPSIPSQGSTPIALILYLLRTQLQLRRALQMAQEQQVAQRQLIMEIDSLIRSQNLLGALSQRVQSRLLINLLKLRAAQKKRLDEPSPSSPLSNLQLQIRAKLQSQLQSQPKGQFRSLFLGEPR